jgi:hypothetical protein
MPEEPTEEELKEHYPENEELPRYIRWLDVVVSFWWIWVVVALLAVLATVAVTILVGFKWPRWSKLFAIWCAVVAPYAYILKNKVREWYWTENYVFGVEFRAEDPGAGGIWRWPTATFRRAENSRFSLDWVEGKRNLFFSRRIEETPDEDGQRLEGTWRGTLEDRELAWSLQKVAECRGQLVEDAARGFLIESSLWTIAFGAAREATYELVEMIEDGTLPDRGDGIDEAVAGALRESELEEIVRDRAGGLDLPDELGADEDAFSDPLGQYEYSDEAEDAAEETDSGTDFEDVEAPERELSADD